MSIHSEEFCVGLNKHTECHKIETLWESESSWSNYKLVEASPSGTLTPQEERSESCSSPLWPHGLEPTRFFCPWDPPGKNTGVGCHSFLQGIFPTQGSNPSLPYFRRILYHLSYQGRRKRKGFLKTTLYSCDPHGHRVWGGGANGWRFCVFAPRSPAPLHQPVSCHLLFTRANLWFK